jgi:hypothetical protein
MNAKSNKRALKAGALAAALVAVLLPTGCNTMAKTPPPPAPMPVPQGQQVSGPAGAAIVPPMHTDA